MEVQECLLPNLAVLFSKSHEALTASNFNLKPTKVTVDQTSGLRTFFFRPKMEDPNVFVLAEAKNSARQALYKLTPRLFYSEDVSVRDRFHAPTLSSAHTVTLTNFLEDHGFEVKVTLRSLQNEDLKHY